MNIIKKIVLNPFICQAQTYNHQTKPIVQINKCVCIPFIASQPSISLDPPQPDPPLNYSCHHHLHAYKMVLASSSSFRPVGKIALLFQVASLFLVLEFLALAVLGVKRGVELCVLSTTVENATQTVTVEEGVLLVVGDVVIVTPIISGIHTYLFSTTITTSWTSIFSISHWLIETLSLYMYVYVYKYIS